MDPVMRKAQKQMQGSSSKASAKGSARSKARKKKKKEPKTQNAGQPTGPGVSSSQRSRSRGAVAPAEETQRSSDEGPGLGTKISSSLVGALHVVDGGLGLTLIIYGAMVHVPSVTAAAVCYGLLQFLGAVAGAVGYYSGAFNRRGLRGSAIAGFLLFVLDLVAFVALFVSWDSFIQFLNDNKEALMLTEDSVKTIEGLRTLFVVIFAVLGGLEVHRGLVMWSLKDTLPSQDTSSRSTGGSKCDILSWLGFSKKKKTDDFVVFDDNASMESALLWSKNGSQPTSDDYLEFVPEHERGLADFHSNVALPTPPEDQIDY